MRARRYFCNESSCEREIFCERLPEVGKVRVLGVDDFAFKKGSTYGTILVNLERHEVVDLLPERFQESLVAWFRSHPAAEMEVATRDHSTIRRGGRSVSPRTRQNQTLRPIGELVGRRNAGR